MRCMPTKLRLRSAQVEEIVDCRTQRLKILVFSSDEERLPLSVQIAVVLSGRHRGGAVLRVTGRLAGETENGLFTLCNDRAQGFFVCGSVSI
jgi:hypothetical protein